MLIVIQQKEWYTGHHIWDVPVDKFAGQRKNVYICEWCYLTATCSVKISILLFYRRLSVTFSKAFLVATWVGIVFNVLYWLTFIICLLALFRPLDAYWLSFDPVWAATHKYSHADERWSLPLSAGLSVLGDFYSTALPLMLIRGLQLPPRQKAALYALFGVGFLVVAAGITRTVLVDRVVAQTYDTSWVLWENWIWTVVELNVAILAASAPALKPFFRRFLIDPIASSSRRAGYVYDSRRRSSAGQARPGHRFNWSNNTSTVRNSNGPVDVEKIGIALTAPLSKAEMIEEEIDDGVSTRRYQLRTSRDGKLVPVQVNEQRGFDARSLHTTKSSDAILPAAKTGNLGAYQHHEGASQVALQLQQYQLEDLTPDQSRSQSKQRMQISDVHDDWEAHDRTPSRSSNKSSSGSMTPAQAKAQQQQHLQDLRNVTAEIHTHTRSISRGSGRNFSLPSTTAVRSGPYQQQLSSARDEDNVRSSSEETLGLPRMGSSMGRAQV